ncbi:MAG: hypothetical protein K8T25_10255 [Planctomycetia bacterium]|nr:hypothetical protein [Planctomycetia bacterium]
MLADLRELIDVFQEARLLLAWPGNNFGDSGWEGTEEALAAMDGILSELSDGTIPDRMQMCILFAPTGPIQETGLNSGWAEEYSQLAMRFEDALDSLPPAEVSTPPATANPPQPQFQFTLRGMLWATAWTAVSVAAWTALLKPAFVTGSNSVASYAALTLVALLAPGAAITALLWHYQKRTILFLIGLTRSAMTVGVLLCVSLVVLLIAMLCIYRIF